MARHEPHPMAASQEVKAADDPTRREPSDDPKYHARPLLDPSGQKGDLPENPDPVPGTITTNAQGQSREILLPDGTPAGGNQAAAQPGGPDGQPTPYVERSMISQPSAKPLPTEEEALQELEDNPERGQVLSVKGWVTRDRLHRVTTTTESRSGIAELTVRTEGGNVTVDRAPV